MKSPLQTFQGREDSVGASDPSLQHSPWEPGECHHGRTLEQGGFEVALGGPAGGRPQATLGGFSQARAPGRRPFPASGGIRAWFGLHAMEGAGCSPPHSDSPQFSGAKSLCSCLGPGSPDSVGGKGPSSGDGQCRVLGELPRPRPSPPVPDMSSPPSRGDASPASYSLDPRTSCTSCPVQASGAGDAAAAPARPLPPAGSWRSGQ